MGKPPAPATMARRLACLSHFYRRVFYEGLLERNPFEFADRPKVPEQAAPQVSASGRARRLIAAASPRARVASDAPSSSRAATVVWCSPRVSGPRCCSCYGCSTSPGSRPTGSPPMSASSGGSSSRSRPPACSRLPARGCGPAPGRSPRFYTPANPGASATARSTALFLGEQRRGSGPCLRARSRCRARGRRGVVLAIRPPRANRSPTAGNPRAGVACAWWVPARESTALVAFLAAKLGQVSPPRTRGTAPETHERSRTV
jgi:hypothetical protein